MKLVSRFTTIFPRPAKEDSPFVATLCALQFSNGRWCVKPWLIALGHVSFSPQDRFATYLMNFDSRSHA